MLWICYPNSPTGAVAPASFLQEAIAWCRERDILLASDEAYSEIYFTEEPPHSVLEFGVEGVIAVFSLSKRSAMTGYRVGWVAGDEGAVGAFRKVKTNIDSGTPTFIQEAAAVALSDLNMPNGSGFYAIKKIQEIDPKAKIIAITADGSYSVEEKLEKLHIPLIQKPFNMDQVISIIRS